MNMSASGRYITGIPSDAVDHFIPMLTSMYNEVNEREPYISLYTIPSIVEAIRQSQMQLWVGVDSGTIKWCMVTEIRIFPAAKLFTLMFGAGEAKRFFAEAQDVFKAFARKHGCTHLSGGGRKGWERVLGDKVKVSQIYYEEL